MKETAKENLLQIKELIEKLSNTLYSQSIPILSNSSIGEHTRHILEFYLLLVSGSFTGTINYDKRDRNKEIEQDREFAIGTINKILDGLSVLNENELVKFTAEFTHNSNGLESSISRELAYCIEHSIHHQALIKAGLVYLNMGNLTDTNFGVAYSTIQYRNQSCAQ